MGAGTKAQIQAMIDANVIPMVIELVEVQPLPVQKEAAWVIVQITAGHTASVQQIRHVAKLGWVKPFCSNLDSEDCEVVRISLEALLALLDKLGEKKKKKGRGKAGSYSEEIKACGGYHYPLPFHYDRIYLFTSGQSMTPTNTLHLIQ
ncbi:uncharacterized protein [Diadema antillarum]|uniref:uncharacterized protein n=1 Tax=Diadema antillarum TaxID=105358 RepID=UPI003A871E20